MIKSGMSLTMAPSGTPLTVCSVNGGHHRCARLASLGIYPGCSLEVISSQPGPLLIKMKESRFAIGRGMAHSILVAPS